MTVLFIVLKPIMCRLPSLVPCLFISYQIQQAGRTYYFEAHIMLVAQNGSTCKYYVIREKSNGCFFAFGFLKRFPLVRHWDCCSPIAIDSTLLLFVGISFQFSHFCCCSISKHFQSINIST